MERKYILIYDTGHDYGEMEFDSQFRANSKNNIQDAKNAMRLKKGKIFKIEQIHLIKE